MALDPLLTDLFSRPFMACLVNLIFGHNIFPLQSVDQALLTVVLLLVLFIALIEVFFVSTSEVIHRFLAMLRFDFVFNFDVGFQVWFFSGKGRMGNFIQQDGFHSLVVLWPSPWHWVESAHLLFFFRILQATGKTAFYFTLQALHPASALFGTFHPGARLSLEKGYDLPELQFYSNIISR